MSIALILFIWNIIICQQWIRNGTITLQTCLLKSASLDLRCDKPTSCSSHTKNTAWNETLKPSVPPKNSLQNLSCSDSTTLHYTSSICVLQCLYRAVSYLWYCTSFFSHLSLQQLHQTQSSIFPRKPLAFNEILPLHSEQYIVLNFQ